MAKQQTANQAAAPATPPADATSQTQDTPPAQQEAPEPQAPQPASEPTVREWLKDLSENSPYLEQQQIAVEALSKLQTAQMWQETAEMWAKLAIDYVAR